MSINCETFYYDSANGESRVFARRWLPPNGQPRASLQIAHGMAEHSGRYEEFATYLAGRGFVVTANDHIGHGLSVAEGQRFGFFAEQNGWTAALSDMETLRLMQSAHWPDLPYFMFGHSMGSFLLRSYLIDYAPTTLSGAILSGSGQTPPPILKLGGLMINLERKRLGPRGLSPLLYLLIQGGYNRRFRPKRTPVDWLSRDEAMVDSYLADRFCRKLPTVSLYGEISAAQAATIRAQNLRRMNLALPLLFVSGDHDPLGHNGKSIRRLCQAFVNAGCTDVQLKLYPGGRHAMLYELNREEVYADIATWLENIIAEKLSEKGGRP